MKFQEGDHVLWYGEIWRVDGCAHTFCRLTRGACVIVVFYDTLAVHQRPWEYKYDALNGLTNWRPA